VSSGSIKESDSTLFESGALMGGEGGSTKASEAGGMREELGEELRGGIIDEASTSARMADCAGEAIVVRFKLDSCFFFLVIFFEITPYWKKFECVK